MLRRILLTAVVLVLAPTLVLAHDGWIAKRDGALTFCYGHGGKLDPYKPEYIREAQAVDAKGNAIPVDIVRHTDYAGVSPKGNPAIVTMMYYSGYGSKLPMDTRTSVNGKPRGKN